jgi:hypothetical protein
LRSITLYRSTAEPTSRCISATSATEVRSHLEEALLRQRHHEQLAHFLRPRDVRGQVWVHVVVEVWPPVLPNALAHLRVQPPRLIHLGAQLPGSTAQNLKTSCFDCQQVSKHQHQQLHSHSSVLVQRQSTRYCMNHAHCGQAHPPAGLQAGLLRRKVGGQLPLQALHLYESTMYQMSSHAQQTAECPLSW